MLSSYVGIIIHHEEDPYETTSIIPSKKWMGPYQRTLPSKLRSSYEKYSGFSGVRPGTVLLESSWRLWTSNKKMRFSMLVEIWLVLSDCILIHTKKQTKQQTKQTNKQNKKTNKQNKTKQNKTNKQTNKQTNNQTTMHTYIYSVYSVYSA